MCVFGRRDGVEERQGIRIAIRRNVGAGQSDSAFPIPESSSDLQVLLALSIPVARQIERSERPIHIRIMRIAVGGLLQETNSFVPFSTTLDTFAAYYILRGDELYTGYKDGKIEIPAFLDVLGEAGVTIVPLIIMAFWIGLYPKPFFDVLDKPVNKIVARVRPDFFQAPRLNAQQIGDRR